MGSTSSKSIASTANNAAASSSSGGCGGRGCRSKVTTRVFQSACLGGTSSRSYDGDRDTDDEEQDYISACSSNAKAALVCMVSNIRVRENGSNEFQRTEGKAASDQASVECFRKFSKDEQSDELPCVSHHVMTDEWGRKCLAGTDSRAGSSSTQASSTRSMNPASRFLSQFSFVPGSVSFRLNRATSLGSSRDYPTTSTNLTFPNGDEQLHQSSSPTNELTNGCATRRGSDLLPSCLISQTSSPRCEDTSLRNLWANSPTSTSFENSHDDQTVSLQNVARDNDNYRIGLDVNLLSPRNHSELESIETRFVDRRIGYREPVERNVRFSRTLSVGRLRDRVLRRSSVSDITFCPLQQQRDLRDDIRGSGSRTRESETITSTTETVSTYTLSNVHNSLFNSQDYQMESSRSREARYQNLLEHRSNILERRRRIRSQVRALQRLGSRFENLSGHERSCILSGQHRSSRCTCSINARDANANDDNSTRASISRIVMLAEALFEVLDEIHQQSVVLSSRPSMSSIGAIPAPNEVVESLPLKCYTKVQKNQNEEAAQCYICLVEYDEGDSMRVLPCHHEFHRTCIDKWLKEIHRVCPLCRRDICRSESGGCGEMN
ncbi:Zinc finger, RING-type [Dillenia turbinata]|uniref:Zinc finger, RING-type n=1 Tax=Dillenia turbinata TaxID=194707 RepID=A0AAN8ZH40_9MAGN